jgi:hypothetical protein
MADDYEYLSIDCPEGHGSAKLILHILEHVSSNGKQKLVDKHAVTQVDCDVQSSLLRKGQNCNWSCRKSEEYKTAIKEI